MFLELFPDDWSGRVEAVLLEKVTEALRRGLFVRDRHLGGITPHLDGRWGDMKQHL
jgi:hypothetical protein